MTLVFGGVAIRAQFSPGDDRLIAPGRSGSVMSEPVGLMTGPGQEAQPLDAAQDGGEQRSPWPYRRLPGA